MVQRRNDIDAVKGFAIVLVVFGHVVARTDPTGVSYYEPLRRAVYAFHMPLFFYLSGLVATLPGGLPGARQFLHARTRRLLVPFFGMGCLIVLAKTGAAGIIFVDNRPAGLLSGLSDLIWRTSASPALSIWYLFVLFTVGLGSFALLDQKPSRLPWLLGASLALYALPLPAYAYADRISTYAVFFIVGLCAGTQSQHWQDFMDRSWRRLAVLLLLSLGVIALWGADLPQKLTLLPVGIIAMPVIHGWLRHLRITSLQAILLLLGRYSFMIYLFNTSCIGLVKGILLAFCSWDGQAFLPFAAALMAAGLLGPIGLKRAVLRRIKTLDRLTD